MAQRILIVEDEPELRRALAVRLEAAGYVCEQAGGGEEGLAKALQQPPDLIVTDLLMEQVDGYELCRQLQRNDRTAAIPVIVLTVVKGSLGRRSKDKQAVQQLVGVTHVLHKPFDSKVLVASVRDALGKAADATGGVQDGSKDHSAR